MSSNEIEKIGANFFEFIKNHSFFETSVFYESIKINQLREVSLDEFLHGLQLKSYDFNVYKSKKNTNNFKINILSKKTKKNFSYNKNFKSLETGVNFARDLVSEPPNVLTPKEYVKRLLKLRKHGIKVTVYNETSLKKLKMFSLLGVGQGSINESYLVTLEWYGNKKNKTKPLSFVGKGVCFDTGGISLKPAKFMEEMKYDMAGSAVVAGLIKNLAMRKSKVNAVGVVGLVENMPGGNAQRPGDIVKSYSGKTIEVLNTDAEGRLVLADVLAYVNKEYKPSAILDFATLTGAVLVALGNRASGVMGNDVALMREVKKASEKSFEKVWELPLWEEYSSEIKGEYADIQNIGQGRLAGTITAGAFLKEFVGDTPWVHMDIAGTAWGPKEPSYQPKVGATGVAVRLVYQLLENRK